MPGNVNSGIISGTQFVGAQSLPNAPLTNIGAALGGAGANVDFLLDQNPTDCGFRIEATCGVVPPAGGIVFGVSFGAAYTFTPKIVWSLAFSSAPLPAGANGVDVVAASNTGFTFKVSAALTPAATYIFDFIILG